MRHGEAMTPDTSAAFPNLQELLYHVQTVNVAPIPPAAPSEDAGQSPFPKLRDMSAALWGCKQEGHPAPQIEATDSEEEIQISSTETEVVPEDKPHFDSEPAEEPFLSGGGLFGVAVPEDSGEPLHFHQEAVHLEADEPATHGISLAPVEDSVAHQPWDDTGWEERGVSLAIGGGLLILLALVLACSVPADWVAALKEKGTQSCWLKNLALFHTWIYGMGSVGLIVLGVGSLRRRRWSVPLIHAGGWLVAITVLMSLAVASAGFFFIAPHSGSGEKTMLSGIARGLIWVGILGVVMPLILIAIYQRQHLNFICGRADGKTRWTDHLPEPLLMLWQCCLIVAVVVSSLFFLNGAFPLMGRMVTGGAGLACISLSVAGCLFAAWLLARQNRLGWWLAWLLFAGITTSGVWTFLEIPWVHVCEAFGRPSALDVPQIPSKLAALLTGAAFAPLSMVLLMSRTSFPVPEEEILPESSLPDGSS
jgi:hypothetical protein